MTKKEFHETVRAEVSKVLEEGKVKIPVVEKVLAVVDNYLEPKKSGGRVNLEEVVKRDEKGNITHILDTVTHIFLPATVENFYEAKNGVGIKVGDVELKRHSRIGEKIRKEFEKTLRASKNAIMQDVLDGKLTPEVGKNKIAALEAQKPDYSEVLKIEGALKA